MLLKNSSLAEAYNQLLLLDIEVRAESFSIDKPLLLWVNDGLMAVFFFLVGLELKKEVMVGQLSNIGNVILPIAGAIGASGQAKNWVFPAFLLLSSWDRLKTKLLGLREICLWVGAGDTWSQGPPT